MDNFFLSALIEEISVELSMKNLIKVLLAGSDLFFDFRLPQGLWLRARLEPTDSAFFLDQFPKSETNEAHPFIAHLKKDLSGAKLISVYKPPLDRMVVMNFETFATSGDRQPAKVILSFAGRNANAYLTGGDNFIEAIFKPRGKFRVGDQLACSNQPFAPHDYLSLVEVSDTQDEIFNKVFNQPDSPFSPILKQEFSARCASVNPQTALSSLLQDLEARPIPLLYSAFPFQAIQSADFQLRYAQNIKNQLILSHFPLTIARERQLIAFNFPSLSEAATAYYEVIEKARALQNDYTSINKLLSEAIKKLEGLGRVLAKESAKFSDPEKFKRFGDLLLANMTTARVENLKTRVIDYYDESQNEIEIDIGEGKTLQQAAANYFALYQKARRAQSIIASRQVDLTRQLHSLGELFSQLNEEITVGQLSTIRKQAEHLLGIKKKSRARTAVKKGEKSRPIGRWYRASGGFDIVVGKNDKDNDAITFRLARAQDIWLHAADYPGSHVIIRNPNRADIPMKVVQEAAELAAFHSQAKEQNKVAVHYTQKKFVTKPPRAKPGLVRLSAFKTITVAPKSILEKIEADRH